MPRAWETDILDAAFWTHRSVEYARHQLLPGIHSADHSAIHSNNRSVWAYVRRSSAGNSSLHSDVERWMRIGYAPSWIHRIQYFVRPLSCSMPPIRLKCSKRNLIVKKVKNTVIIIILIIGK